LAKINTDKVIQYLAKRWKTGCFQCGERNWNVSNEAYEYREFNYGNMVIGGDSAITPVVLVTCMGCGNTLSLNALICGAIDQNAKQPS
jgi:hypothetical protein